MPTKYITTRPTPDFEDILTALPDLVRQNVLINIEDVNSFVISFL